MVCGLGSCVVCAPEVRTSVVATHELSICGTGAPELGLNSCCVCISLLQGLWNLTSLSGDRTRSWCIARWILNHWTTREVPWLNYHILKKKDKYLFVN